MRSLLPDGLYQAFFTVMVIMLAAYVLRAVCQYFVTVIGHRMGTLVEADMRRDVFMHMQELSYSFFDRNRTGVLLARVTNDLFEIVELAHHGPENILTCFLTIVGAIVILFTFPESARLRRSQMKRRRTGNLPRPMRLSRPAEYPFTARWDSSTRELRARSVSCKSS